MLNNFLTDLAILLIIGSLLLFFTLEFYINLFEAEKLRQKIVALPEFRSTWFFWAELPIPFKWWHFYRKGVFSFWMAHAWSAGPRSKNLCSRKAFEVMPRLMRRIYKSEV